MTPGKLTSECVARDVERLARYRRLIIHGRPAVAQRALEILADEEKERNAQRSDRYTREVGA